MVELRLYEVVEEQITSVIAELYIMNNSYK